MKKLIFVSAIVLTACVDLSGPEYNRIKDEQFENIDSDTLLLKVLEPFGTDTSKEVRAATFNRNMVLYWDKKNQCHCLLNESQTFLINQYNGVTGDISL